MSHRTRIKICGLTREQDVQAAIVAGADALGFVFYPKSPRYVTPQQAARLLATVPPFITTVGLFVNAEPGQLADVVAEAPVSLLQFHGDETVAHGAALAQRVNRPFIQAMRVGTAHVAADLLEYAQAYRSGSRLFAGLLLDTLVEGYGGSGKVFDWSLIPKELAPQVVLSGGLSVHNATDAVKRVRPFAVDISSGVEQEKGIKDAAKIRAFIDAVRQADAEIGGL
ncbi:N-(5'phosphoribosyl)anthranilate (PRA) isomerase family protein [Collimonas arenae]|uniref:N-(5'-phosphoribosyl)anthranilate isomerase n=1 Tax=Collimonas arenae TaxID=279058 RepID=A0A127QJQ9_9BURK|nr:phosphoribosylanthranilate isomerase [Collimonas arenae]AMP00395.1 N-(5'phosphoribosyl)anthranilate (PRA) isomerase family protein [Collimonas arenae]AMP10273.1 N-(5'phosphoribosyl)anthranilate (PRA) isomerase family protein [Collimonas arenae]